METQVILCTGTYAKTPYYLEKFGVNLFSIEELCYYMCENAYLIDKDFMEEDLIAWIDTECSLKSLARQLYTLIHNDGSVSAFVGIILEETCYISKPERELIEKLLTQNRNMDLSLRKKNRADYFLEHGLYTKALLEYDQLQYEVDPKRREILGAIHHNKGVALARLFTFEQAAAEFLEAYRILNMDECYLEYLAALHLYLSKDEYIKEVMLEHNESAYSVKLEQKIEQVMEWWKESNGAVLVENLKKWKNSDNSGIYYETLEKTIDTWKEEYRGCVNR